MAALGKKLNLHFDKISQCELFKYLTVGLLTMMIQMSFTALNIEILEMDYSVGVGLAYFGAVCFHFFANRKFTFSVSHKNWYRQLPRYIVLLLTNFIITIVIVTFLVENLYASAYLSTLVAIAVTVGIGFMASKIWVYQ